MKKSEFCFKRFSSLSYFNPCVEFFLLKQEPFCQYSCGTKILLTSLPMVRKDVVINPNSQLGPMSFTLKECNNNKCIQENKHSVSHYLGRKGSASRRTQLLNKLKFVVPSRETNSVQILKEAQSNTKTPSYQIRFFLHCGIFLLILCNAGTIQPCSEFYILQSWTIFRHDHKRRSSSSPNGVKSLRNGS